VEQCHTGHRRRSRGLTIAKQGRGNTLFALGVALLRLALELLLMRVVFLGLRLQREIGTCEARPRGLQHSVEPPWLSGGEPSQPLQFRGKTLTRMLAEGLNAKESPQFMFERGEVRVQSCSTCSLPASGATT